MGINGWSSQVEITKLYFSIGHNHLLFPKQIYKATGTGWHKFELWHRISQGVDWVWNMFYTFLMQEVTQSLANDTWSCCMRFNFFFHLFSFCQNEHVTTVFGSFPAPAPKNCSTLFCTLNTSSLNVLEAGTLDSIISAFAEAEKTLHFCAIKIPQLRVCWNSVLPSC